MLHFEGQLYERSEGAEMLWSSRATEPVLEWLGLLAPQNVAENERGGLYEKLDTHIIREVTK